MSVVPLFSAPLNTIGPRKRKKPSISIDLFCGGGGFSLGYRMATGHPGEAMRRDRIAELLAAEGTVVVLPHGTDAATVSAAREIAAMVGRTCDTCAHDAGRVCRFVANAHREHPDDPGDLARSVQLWATAHCDDETLRPLPGAPGCPGFALVLPALTPASSGASTGDER